MLLELPRNRIPGNERNPAHMKYYDAYVMLEDVYCSWCVGPLTSGRVCIRSTESDDTWCSLACYEREQALETQYRVSLPWWVRLRLWIEEKLS